MFRRHAPPAVLIVAVVLATASPMAAPQASKPLPNIVVLATGGTIAGAAGPRRAAGYTVRGRSPWTCSSPPCRR